MYLILLTCQTNIEVKFYFYLFYFLSFDLTSHINDDCYAVLFAD